MTYTRGLADELDHADPLVSPEHRAALQRVPPRRGILAAARSEASADLFVRKEMAKGELVRQATKYTQSGPACALQLAAAGVPLGVVGTVTLGSVLGGLAVGTAGVAVLGLLMILETSNRIVVTNRALVVQSSVLLDRFELDKIEDLRVETMGPRQWLRLDVRVLDPRFFFKKAPGLRFRYRKSPRKIREVFIAVEDAHEYARLMLGSA